MGSPSVDPGSARQQPWRRRDFRIAWAAGWINNTGDWVLNVALPVHVFVETGSGSSTALLFVCQVVVTALLAPIGGALVDRWDLRRTLVATNLAQAVALVPLLAVDGSRLWPAYVVVALQAALSRLNDPANVALLPRVVAEDELAVANAALAASASLVRLGGAPLGGVLVAWHGLAPVVALDAASFLVVALALAFLRADTAPVPLPDGEHGEHGEHGDRRLRGGWRAMRSHPPLAALFGVTGFGQIAQGGFVVLFVAFVVEELGDDGARVGLIRGTMAIGALIGAAVIGRVARRVEPTVLFAWGMLGMGVVSLVFWNAPTVTTALWVYPALFALSGIPGAALQVGLVTTVQTRSPAHVLGRVSGLMGLADAVGTALGSIVVGVLVDRVALRPLLDAQAAVYLVAAGLTVLFVIPASRRQRTGV